MIWKIKMREAFQTKRSARIIAVLTGAVIAVAAAGYLFFHNPHQYPLPCLFHIITGLYCPGCGAGRAILFYMEDFIRHSGIIRCM